MKRVILLILLGIVATGLYAQNLRVDFSFNTKAEDSSNYFNWSLGNSVTKDGFDASTGASTSGSTYGFDVVRYDQAETKNPTIPAALRNIFLFPVSPFGIAIGDNVTVEETKEGLVIRFVHRGVAYELVTDKKGNFNVQNGARIGRGLAENIGGKFILKEEFIKEGTDGSKASDLDWTKVELVPDTRSVSASRWYEGTLRVKYTKDILTMKGTLKEVKR